MSTEEELLRIRSIVKRPSDFHKFWSGTLNELERTEVEWHRSPLHTFSAPDYTITKLDIASIGDTVISGWLAVPDGLKDPAPGYLWLPGYSLGNPKPGPESLYEGVVTLGLNVHGNAPDTPYAHPFDQGRDYILQGIESPYTYIFRRIVAHCVRAFEALAGQPEVDSGRVVVGGMSQGGGLALIVAALLQSRVALCFADMPWLCDFERAISLIDRERYRRRPEIRVPDGRFYIAEYAESVPKMRDSIVETVRYFDPLSHAANIVSPVQMSAGGRDPTCRPPTVYAVYNELTAERQMLFLPNVGHEIVRPMWEAHANWVLSRLQ